MVEYKIVNDKVCVLTNGSYIEAGVVDIGQQKESGAVKISFDVSELVTAYGSGSATVVHKRANDARPYVVQGTTYDSTSKTVVWTVSNADNAHNGVGMVEIRWVVGGVLAKTIVCKTRTLTGLVDETTETPGSTAYMVKGVGDLMKSVTNLGVTEGPDGAIEIFGNGIKGATISVSDTSGAYIYKIVTGPVMINAGRVNSITIPSGSSYVDASITFSDEFGEAPYLQVTGKSSSTNINTVPVPIVLSTTKTGASVRVWRNGSDTSAAAYPQLWWMAIGKA